MEKLLVTGGAGFIGSNFVRFMLEREPACHIVTLDALTYAGDLKNLAGLVDHPRHTFIHGDITDADLVHRLACDGVTSIVNFAAESHVDRSISNPGIFIRTNVMGTQVLLEAARQAGNLRFLQVSTDEVYGSLGVEGYFTEVSPLKPSSPYSASKASADLLALAHHHTFGLPVSVTRCSNNYGPNQHVEKLVPRLISEALKGQALPLYGSGLNVRDWLYVEDHCEALALVLRHGRHGEVYNVGGSYELTNLEVATQILQALDLPLSRITYVPDRPGHDWRYAIDATKLCRELGWKPRHSFVAGLLRTIEWYRARSDRWLRNQELA